MRKSFDTPEWTDPIKEPSYPALKANHELIDGSTTRSPTFFFRRREFFLSTEKTGFNTHTKQAKPNQNKPNKNISPPSFTQHILQQTRTRAVPPTHQSHFGLGGLNWCGSTLQIFSAYSLMLLSEENRPILAHALMVLAVHSEETERERERERVSQGHANN